MECQADKNEYFLLFAFNRGFYCLFKVKIAIFWLNIFFIDGENFSSGFAGVNSVDLTFKLLKTTKIRIIKKTSFRA